MEITADQAEITGDHLAHPQHMEITADQAEITGGHLRHAQHMRELASERRLARARAAAQRPAGVQATQRGEEGAPCAVGRRGEHEPGGHGEGCEYARTRVRKTPGLLLAWQQCCYAI